MKNEKAKPISYFNNFSPLKFCINLDRRPDRWKKMQTVFAQHGITQVKRFAAIDGRGLKMPRSSPIHSSAYGCLLSHLTLVKQARKKRAHSVLILEDDCIFDELFNKKFSLYVDELPSDWDMLLFGGWHWQEPVMISDNLGRVKLTCLSHAYALNRSLYDAFIELCERRQEPVDNYMVALQNDFNCYCFIPDLVWQEGADSDIRHGYMKYE